MRKLIFFLPLIACWSVVKAQATLSPDVIASNGGVSRFNGIELEWTVGEAAIGTAAAGNRLYTVGFHQPVLISRQLPAAGETASRGIRVFPNPASQMLRVQLPLTGSDNVTIVLADLAGNTLVERTVNNKSSAVDIQIGHLASGMYQLRIISPDGNQTGVFKIVKVN